MTVPISPGATPVFSSAAFAALIPRSMVETADSAPLRSVKGVERGKAGDGAVAPILAGDRDVAKMGSEMRDGPRAHRPDADPCPRRKLEILGDAAVEPESLVGIALVDPLQRVAEPIIALLVEGSGGGLRIAPIP